MLISALASSLKPDQKPRALAGGALLAPPSKKDLTCSAGDSPVPGSHQLVLAQGLSPTSRNPPGEPHDRGAEPTGAEPCARETVSHWLKDTSGPKRFMLGWECSHYSSSR